MGIDEIKELVGYLYQENQRLELDLIDMSSANRMEVVGELQKENDSLRKQLRLHNKQISDLLSWASQHLSYEQYFSMLSFVEKARP